MGVKIEAEECIGCESCVQLCPEVFAFDPDTEKAYVRPDAEAGADCVQEAIDTCPVTCIHLE